MKAIISLPGRLPSVSTWQAFRLALLLIIAPGLMGISSVPLWGDPPRDFQSGLDQSPASFSGTITLWHAYGPGSAEETALNQVIQEAESANPGLDIVPEYHDFGQIYGDYESAVLGGGGPDMYIAPNDSLGNQVRSGVVLNIDGYLQGQLANVEQKAIDGMKVDGLLYGVPESAKAVALYYNSSMIDTPPATTAELFTLLQGDETLSSPANAYHFYGLWSAFGGQLMDGTGRCVADQGGFVDAMEYLLDLQAAGAALTDYGNAESMFLNGQTGMLLNGPWALAYYEDTLGADLGVAVLPDGPSGDAQAMNGIDGFYVNPNSSIPANVVQVALLLTNQASSQVWTDVGGHIPVRSDVTSSDPLISAFAQASAGSEPRPQNVELNNYWGPFQEMIDKVLGGNETPAVGIQRACNTMNVLNGFTPSTNTITLWHAYPTGGGEESALNQIIDSAEAADPDLTVVATQHGFADIYTDYENAVLGGGGPDMYIAPNDNLGSQVRNDTVLNIDGYLQGQLTNVDQTAIDGMKVAGLLYGVPESAKAVALYYNTTMIAAPPTTTAELLTLLQSGEILAAPGYLGSYFFYGFWSAFGGQLMNSGGRCIADQGGFAPAMQYLLDLQNAGAVLQTDDYTAAGMFLSGDVGMLIDGPWKLAEYKASMGSDLGVIALPSGPSGVAEAMLGIDGFYVNPNTANLASTIALALYMTNQASSQVWTDVGGHVPVRSDVTSSDPLISAFGQAAAQGDPRPQNIQLNNYWGPFQDMINDVLVETVLPQTGVQRACKTMNLLNGFTVSDTYYSSASNDGWVLESTETSGVGGTLNQSSTTLVVGDNASDRQYRGILSFNTSALPNNAVITSVVLKTKKYAIVGTAPFSTHNGLRVDIRKPYFGSGSSLQLSDFQASASRTLVGTFGSTASSGWLSVSLSSTAFPYVNLTGTTQFRLRFYKDDNDDRAADYLRLYSGNAASSNRPKLIVTYYVP